MGKPCEKCDDYDRDKEECRILKQLRILSLDEQYTPDEQDVKLARRGKSLSELFY
jgi:hypothetical protein